MSVTKESQSSSMIMWVLSIFIGFLSGLIFFFIKKDDAFTHNNAKEALNIGITVFIAFIIAGILIGVLGKIGMLIYMVVYVYWLYCCIMGAIKATKGESFAAPFALRLIK